jgi:hypothetical protein
MTWKEPRNVKQDEHFSVFATLEANTCATMSAQGMHAGKAARIMISLDRMAHQRSWIE